MKPIPKQSEVVTKAVLRIVDRLGMPDPAPDHPVIYLRAPNELVIGTGDHDCNVYQLTPGQLANLAIDSVRLALAQSESRAPYPHTDLTAGTAPRREPEP